VDISIGLIQILMHRKIQRKYSYVFYNHKRFKSWTHFIKLSPPRTVNVVLLSCGSQISPKIAPKNVGDLKAISQTFNEQLLLVKIPKAQKDTSDLTVYFAL
jgi:hypothetical protein